MDIKTNTEIFNKKWLLLFKKKMATALAIGILLVIVKTPLPLFYAFLIDKVLLAKNHALLFQTVSVMITFILLDGVITYILKVYTASMRCQALVFLRTNIYKKLQRIPYKYYLSYMSGDLTTRLTSDLDEIDQLLPNGIALLIKDILLVLGLTGIILYLNWKLTLISFLLIPLFWIVFKQIFGRINHLSKTTLDNRGKMKSKFQESIEGLKHIQTNNAYEHYANENINSIEKSEIAQLNLSKEEARMQFTITGFPITGSIILWGIGGIGIFQNWITLGEIIAFSYVFNFLFQPLSSLVMKIGHIQMELQAIKRIQEFLSFPSKTTASSEKIDINKIISFKDISFQYGEDSIVLKNCDITIPSGEITAIVGPNGCGKTTFLSLLLRLIEPDSGKILLANQDIQNISLDSWRDQIGMVPQDIFIFQGSLKDNILMGRNVSEDNLKHACELSGLDELINSFQEGIDTPLIEKGQNLSGGQKQKIGIARALATNPSLIILDEPTNSLDIESTERISAALKLANQGKTILLVTHDTTLLKTVPNIYYFNNKSLRRKKEK